ncbi:MAG: tetratricopeptide repeat protein [Planctomycetes bacterium]|jgi:TolA-binding protein|nr:tetratricopeptide repeat protein [Phycisphaerae bacterium]NBB96106.1 tetratricopeptide repeat protein [Planctomycetota bacterium]
MSARTVILILLPLAAWLGGCSANEAWFKPGEHRFLSPDKAAADPDAAQPRPVVTRGEPQADVEPAGPTEVEAFESALTQVTALQYEPARETLKPLVARFAAADLDRYASESLFWLGFCSERLKDPAKAKEYYMRAVYGYPDTPASRQARVRLKSLGP